MRISGAELDHDGLTEDEVLEACRALAADGELDYYNVIAGSSASRRRRHPYRAAHGDRHRLCGALRRRGARGRGQAGLRRRPHQPAADRRAGAGLGPGRYVRHDPGDDLRSRDAGQDRGRASSTTSAPASAATRPASAISIWAMPSPASSIPRRAASSITARLKPAGAPQARADRRRRAGRHEGRGGRRGARP